MKQWLTKLSAGLQSQPLLPKLDGGSRPASGEPAVCAGGQDPAGAVGLGNVPSQVTLVATADDDCSTNDVSSPGPRQATSSVSSHLRIPQPKTSCVHANNGPVQIFTCILHVFGFCEACLNDTICQLYPIQGYDNYFDKKEHSWSRSCLISA